MKSVLITGGGRGIGRALCLEALKRGYKVHATVRNIADAPAGVEAHLLDIRDRPAVAALLSKLASELDFFIANAGIDQKFDPSHPDCADRAAQVFEVNGTATAFCVYRLAHEWVKRGCRGKRLAVVSSLAAGRGLPGAGAYVATKTAELALCQSLDFDLEKHGLGVSVIQPGFIDTEMSKHQPQRPFLISAERAAELTWNGLEEGKFRIAYPRATDWLSWLGNQIPYAWFRFLMRKLR